MGEFSVAELTMERPCILVAGTHFRFRAHHPGPGNSLIHETSPEAMRHVSTRRAIASNTSKVIRSRRRNASWRTVPTIRPESRAINTR